MNRFLLILGAGAALLAGACATHSRKPEAIAPISVQGDLASCRLAAENLLKRVYRATADDPDRMQFDDVRDVYEEAAADVNRLIEALCAQHVSRKPLGSTALRIHRDRIDASRRAFEEQADSVLNSDRGGSFLSLLVNPVGTLVDSAISSFATLAFGGESGPSDEELQAQALRFTNEFSWRPASAVIREARRERNAAGAADKPHSSSDVRPSEVIVAATAGDPEPQADSPSAARKSDALGLGLFIGMGTYRAAQNPGDSALRTLDGAPLDAQAMREALARIGLVPKENSSLLTNDEVTRANIRDEFEKVVGRARKERAGMQRVRVVLFYAGHGRQVPDAPDGDEVADHKDESWTTCESTTQDGSQDVLDDDVGAFSRQLLGMGCEVLLISDSCHSGTIDRGSSEDTIPRNAGGGGALKGPSGPLREIQELRGTDDDWIKAGLSTPRFIAIGACQADEVAFESKQSKHGLLTLALLRTLSRLGDMTFGQFEPAFQRAFVDVNTRRKSQRPYFAMTLEESRHRVVDGAVPRLHGKATRMEGGLGCGLGYLSGVGEGTTIQVYSSLAGLEAGDRPIAEGWATQVRESSCLIRVQDAQETGSVPPAAVAAIGPASAQVLRVRVDPKCGDLAGCIEELRAGKRVAIVEESGDAEVVVAPHQADGKRIEIRWAGDSDQIRLPPLALAEPGDCARLEQSLEGIALVRGLFAIAQPYGGVDVSLCRITMDGTRESFSAEGGAEVARPANRQLVTGTTTDCDPDQLRPEDRFAVDIHNATSSSVYVQLFEVLGLSAGPALRLVRCFPSAGAEGSFVELAEVKPGEHRIVGSEESRCYLFGSLKDGPTSFYKLFVTSEPKEMPAELPEREASRGSLADVGGDLLNQAFATTQASRGIAGAFQFGAVDIVMRVAPRAP